MLAFLGPEFLGEFPLDPGAHPKLRWRREGAALFCPDCGEVWGRLVFIDSRDLQVGFEPFRVACIQHPDQWEVAGSLLATGLEGLLPLLPEPALRREFAVHMKHYQEGKL